MPNKEFLHVILIHYFNMREFVSESQQILADVYGDVVPTEKYCQNLFERFKSGNFEYKEQSESTKIDENKDGEQAGSSKTDEEKDMEQAGTLKKIDYEEMKTDVNTSEVVLPEVLTAREVLIHYHKIKNIYVYNPYQSVNYLLKTFGNRSQTEQECQKLIEKFKRGIYILEDAEQADILKKIEELETWEKEALKEECRKSRKPYIPSSKKLFFQRVLLHCFHLNKKCSESYKILRDFYHPQHPSDRTCYRIFEQFKKGHFDLENEKFVQKGRPKKFKDEDLKTLLKENSRKTQREIANILGVRQRVVSHRLKNLGFIRKYGNWVLMSTSTNKTKSNQSEN